MLSDALEQIRRDHQAGKIHYKGSVPRFITVDLPTGSKGQIRAALKLVLGNNASMAEIEYVYSSFEKLYRKLSTLYLRLENPVKPGRANKDRTEVDDAVLMGSLYAQEIIFLQQQQADQSQLRKRLVDIVSNTFLFHGNVNLTVIDPLPAATKKKRVNYFDKLASNTEDDDVVEGDIDESDEAEEGETTAIEEPTDDDLHDGAIIYRAAELDNELDNVDTDSKKDMLTIYLNQARNYPVLDKDSTTALAWKYFNEKDRKAYEKLCNHNLRLVIKLAALARRRTGDKFSLLDLIQEGNIGLMRGIELFDPGRSYRLSTYVSWWINEKIWRFMRENSSLIRVPSHAVDIANHVRDTKHRLILKLGREPTNKEIADDLGVPQEKIERIMLAQKTVASLDAPFSDEDDSKTFLELIACSEELHPDVQTITLEQKAFIQKVLADMNTSDQMILQRRFGIKGRPETLEEIGASAGMTRERMRQIEERAKKAFLLFAEVFNATPPHPSLTTIIEAIKNDYTPKTWSEIAKPKRPELRFAGRGLIWIMRAFKLRGNPLDDFTALLRLGGKIFGYKEMSAINDGYSTALRQVTGSSRNKRNISFSQKAA